MVRAACEVHTRRRGRMHSQGSAFRVGLSCIFVPFLHCLHLLPPMHVTLVYNIGLHSSGVILATVRAACEVHTRRRGRMHSQGFAFRVGLSCIFVPFLHCLHLLPPMHVTLVYNVLLDGICTTTVASIC
jgi:hypothetical protein